MTKLRMAVAWFAVLLVAIGGANLYFGHTTATLMLKVKDPPLSWGDADVVEIHYSAIEIHRSDADEKNGWVSICKEGWIDLSTALDVEKVINEAKLEPGVYNIIRFEVLEAKITIDDASREVKVSSGKLNIPITKGGITLSGGQTSNLVIDIEPRVVGSKNSGYMLIPAAKAVPG